MTYFYARVSSKDQNLDRQLEAARSYEGKIDRIFVDKESGKNFERPSWKEMCSVLSSGDLVIVLDLDRIGRNYEETPKEWARITKEIGADIQVLNMPLLDTRKNGNDLTERFVADLVLQILVYVAENERRTSKRRQKEGIDAMPIVNGKKVSAKTGNEYGRPKSSIDDKRFKSLFCKQKRGEITVNQICADLGISRSTWYARVRSCEAI